MMSRMKWVAGFGALALIVASVATACVNGDDNVNPNDGSTPDQTTSGGYTVTLSTPSVVVDPGASTPVTVTIARTGSFSDAINVNLTGGPTGVTGSAVVPSGQNSVVLDVQAATTATVGTVATAMVGAASTPSNVMHSVPLAVRVGHILLTANTTTTWTVPADVTAATVVAWGAGGGSGGGFSGVPISGGNGGAGGFGQADFVFTPGQVINVIVGTGGAGGPEVSCGGSCPNGSGAGGGGYTALVAPILDAGADASQILILAAGGGGGQGGGDFGPPYGGFAGGAGGGPTGVIGGATNGQGTLAGGPGSTSAGGASAVQAGTSLAGGAAGSGADGGVPGGGSGSLASGGGGGGGGGYFGGGAGSTQPNGGGGGGGSGFVLASAANATMSIGDGGAPPAMTLTYYGNNAGVGGLGSAAAGIPGGPGRVVIFLH